MADPDRTPRRRTLASIIGAGAAALVLTLIPLEESGRTVKVKIDPVTTEASITHLSGPQYLRVYKDIVGVATACDGLTRGMRMGMTFSPAHCDRLLETELVATATAIRSCSPGLFDGRHDGPLAASILLAHNIGTAGFCGSTANRMFRAGKVGEGCDAFLAWDKVTRNGRKERLKALADRRQRERALCLRGAAR